MRKSGLVSTVVVFIFLGVSWRRSFAVSRDQQGGELSDKFSTVGNLNAENNEGNKTETVNIADLVEKVLPAIVTINVVKSRQNHDYNYFTYSDQPEDIILGSGFLISGDGKIITNSHLIEYAEKITVKIGDEEMDAELIGRDRFIDVALLRVNASRKFKNFFTLKPSVSVRVGERVFTIGNPWGLGISVSSGIISAVNRTMKDPAAPSYSYMQIDAAMNAGNSGGPVFNTMGELIGMSTFMQTRVGENNGLGFALPIDEHVVGTVERLIKFGYRQNGYFGVVTMSLDNTNSDYMKIFNVKKNAILVKYVGEDSPAEDSGILPGDIILSYDGTKVDDPNVLKNMIRNTSIGSKVEIVVFRNEKYLKFKVQISENPFDKKYSDLNRRIANNSMEILGMFMGQVDDNLVERYELYSKYRGMYVLDVKKGGWADINGVERGDVLIAVNQTQIAEKKDLLQVFDNMKLNGRKDFVMFFRKQKYRDSIVLRSDLSCINY
ncbi:MAG: trypsin-like peptidase domain-containing protein [Rickettsiales bacterium]|jgi:serine protease Do|nr:trypsin-like peptidase domain-containing protein [Rickettsiales bacterium]